MDFKPNKRKILISYVSGYVISYFLVLTYVGILIPDGIIDPTKHIIKQVISHFFYAIPMSLVVGSIFYFIYSLLQKK